MKNTKFIYVIIIFYSQFFMIYGQKNPYKFKKEIIKIDTLNFYQQEKFQGFVNSLKKDNYYLPEIENDQYRQLLDSKFKAIEFTKLIIKIKFGKKYPNYPKKFTIGEDKDKNLWFVNCQFLNAVLDGNVYFVIVKSNCKILFFYENG